MSAVASPSEELPRRERDYVRATCPDCGDETQIVPSKSGSICARCSAFLITEHDTKRRRA